MSINRRVFVTFPRLNIVGSCISGRVFVSGMPPSHRIQCGRLQLTMYLVWEGKVTLSSVGGRALHTFTVWWIRRLRVTISCVAKVTLSSVGWRRQLT